MKHSFNPFDRVLVRDGDDCTWRIQFFSHLYEDLYACLNGVHTQCIPYEGNENLLGTTDSPEPEFKKGDAVLVWDEHNSAKRFRIYSHYDSDFHKHVVFDVAFSDGSTRSHMWGHAEKYVPASVEG